MSGPFEDVPLFGSPSPEGGPVKWELSKRDQEDAAKPRWLRYRGPTVPCAKARPDRRQRCRPVTWLLVIGTKEIPLCSAHKQEHLDDQFLRTPRGSQ